MPEIDEKTLRLSNGRVVAWSEYGDPSGVPLLHLHGTGFSRLEAACGADAAKASGIRLIAPDRAGFGRSSSNAKSTLMSGAEDMSAVVDSLQLRRFVVSGFSGGFPHALAMAARMPDRVVSIIGMNTAGALADPQYSSYPRLARTLLWVGTTPPASRFIWKRMFSDLDSLFTASTDLETQGKLKLAMTEGGRVNGLDPVVRELTMFYHRPWHRLWRNLRTSATLLHGESDPNLKYAQALARCIPGLQLEVISGGHMDGHSMTAWRKTVRLVLEEASKCEQGAS